MFCIFSEQISTIKVSSIKVTNANCFQAATSLKISCEISRNSASCLLRTRSRLLKFQGERDADKARLCNARRKLSAASRRTVAWKLHFRGQKSIFSSFTPFSVRYKDSWKLWNGNYHSQLSERVEPAKDKILKIKEYSWFFQLLITELYGQIIVSCASTSASSVL